MSDPKKTGPDAASRQERRRTPRHPIRAPIRVTIEDEVLHGVTDNFSYNGVLVQTREPLPPLGTMCAFSLDLPLGSVEAHAKVVRHDPGVPAFALDITRIDKNGQLLLVALILEGDDED